MRLLLLLVLAGFITGCSPEMKIAKTFVEEPPDINILLTPPEALYKFSQKPDTAYLIISEVDDSVFLEGYVNSFMDELRMLRFSVYLKGTAEEYLKEKQQAYEVNMAQVQMDEYFYPLVDSAEFWDTIYIKEFELNAVDLSSWFELKKMGKDKPIVLFNTYSLGDGFEGSFFNEPWSAIVKYRYRIDNLVTRDVQDAGEQLGRRYARLLYDFFLNQYIRYNMPDGMEPYQYYHYNRLTNSFVPVVEDKFEIIESEQ